MTTKTLANNSADTGAGKGRRGLDTTFDCHPAIDFDTVQWYRISGMMGYSHRARSQSSRHGESSEVYLCEGTGLVEQARGAGC